MRKFYCPYDMIIEDTEPLIVDYEDFQKYMENVVMESIINEFKANNSAKDIIIF